MLNSLFCSVTRTGLLSAHFGSLHNRDRNLSSHSVSLGYQNAKQGYAVLAGREERSAGGTGGGGAGIVFNITEAIWVLKLRPR